MRQVELSDTEWLKIIDGSGDDPIEIKPVAGTVTCSLARPGNVGTITLSADHQPQESWTFRQTVVEPGVSVYARAVEGAATVALSTMKPQA